MYRCDWKSRIHGASRCAARRSRPGPAGFGEIRQLDARNIAAGNYTVSLSIVRNHGGADLIGSTVVQVRDFLPDRLKMTMKLLGGIR